MKKFSSVTRFLARLIALPFVVGILLIAAVVISLNQAVEFMTGGGQMITYPRSVRRMLIEMEEERKKATK
jgi:hypothetical protein